MTLLDQRLLPREEKYHTYRDYTSLIEAIRSMEVRGAPAIGIAAGMAAALAALNIEAGTIEEFRKKMNEVIGHISAARPTAVSLFYALKRMKKIIDSSDDIETMKKRLEKEAIKLYDEDLQANKAIGKNGLRYIDTGDVIMTHCNAGSLATAGYGTALGVVRSAMEAGKRVEVFACETRPLLQGARLTAWELLSDGIPVTVITDSMAGHFMKSGSIKMVIVGADRIARNGDTANKIGTYSLSVLAKEHRIPFYVAAPLSTFDLEAKTGDEIPIEERGMDEVAFIGGVQVVPEGVFIRNPSFDVTPAANISAIITERGVIEKPDEGRIAQLLK